MKIVKTAAGQKLHLSQQEWKELGKKAGWIVAKKKKRKKKDVKPEDMTQLELMRQQRKPTPPPGGPMSTQKGKRGYDRKDKGWKKDLD